MVRNASLGSLLDHEDDHVIRYAALENLQEEKSDTEAGGECHERPYDGFLPLLYRQAKIEEADGQLENEHGPDVECLT